MVLEFTGTGKLRRCKVLCLQARKVGAYDLGLWVQ